MQHNNQNNNKLSLPSTKLSRCISPCASTSTTAALASTVFPTSFNAASPMASDAAAASSNAAAAAAKLPEEVVVVVVVGGCVEASVCKMYNL